MHPATGGFFIMSDLVHLYVDDFADFLLEAFVDHRIMTGRYPRILYVSHLLGQMMKCRPGIWRPTRGFGGIWGWVKYLPAGVADGRDEFGQPD